MPLPKLKKSEYISMVIFLLISVGIVAIHKNKYPHTFSEPELIELVKYDALTECDGKIGSGARTCTMSYSEPFRNEQKIFAHLESHGWTRFYSYEETFENMNSDAYRKGRQQILMKDDIFKYRSGTHKP